MKFIDSLADQLGCPSETERFTPATERAIGRYQEAMAQAIQDGYDSDVDLLIVGDWELPEAYRATAHRRLISNARLAGWKWWVMSLEADA